MAIAAPVFRRGGAFRLEPVEPASTRDLFMAFTRSSMTAGLSIRICNWRNFYSAPSFPLAADREGTRHANWSHINCWSWWCRKGC